MADDCDGVHFSPLKVVVAGYVTRNAFKNSNALRVTKPATYFFSEKCCIFWLLWIFNFLFLVLEL